MEMEVPFYQLLLNYLHHHILLSMTIKHREKTFKRCLPTTNSGIDRDTRAEEHLTNERKIKSDFCSNVFYCAYK